MNLPSIDDLKIDQNIVFVRGDLDVRETEKEPRLEAVIQTVKHLLEKGAYKVIIAGHNGRPGGVSNEENSLQSFTKYFSEQLETEVSFVPHELFDKFSGQELYNSRIKVYLLENLRFWPGEKESNTEFVNKLAGSMADIYVNEAFGSSHREHASIVALPKVIREKGGQLAVGFRFAEEVDHLSRVLNNPKHPSILLLSGVKEDKVQYIEPLKEKFDRILIAGRLSEYMEEVKVSVKEEKGQIIVGELNQDKEDITVKTIERFESEVAKAGTVVISGPLGKYEDEGQRLGTKRVFQAVVDSNAFKIAGGGDTEEALMVLSLAEKFDWVSVGGGAMLEYLSKGTLPGIEALL